MKNFLLLIVISLNFGAFSQRIETKRNLKKMGYTMSEFAYSQEKVILYPRGFIYKIDEPDSVFYFGCFDSDTKDVTSYFEGKSKTPKFSGNNLIIREAVDVQDSIFILPINSLILNFKTFEGKQFELNNEAKYVIIYYWANKILDKYYYKNFKQLKKIAKNHPDLQIQVIAVSTDKLN